MGKIKGENKMSRNHKNCIFIDAIKRLLVVMIIALCTMGCFQLSTQASSIKIKNAIVFDGTFTYLEQDDEYKIKGVDWKKASFKSSNRKVLTVTKKGVIKTKRIGKATVKIKIRTKKKVKIKKFKIIVSPYENEVEKIELYDELVDIAPGPGIKEGKQTYKLAPGDKRKLYCNVEHTDIMDAHEYNELMDKYPCIVYVSSNKKVAKVNRLTGEITAKTEGTTKITAYATDGSGKKRTMKITVSRFVKADESNVRIYPAKNKFSFAEPVTYYIENKSQEPISYFRGMSMFTSEGSYYIYKKENGRWDLVTVNFFDPCNPERSGSRILSYRYIIAPGATEKIDANDLKYVSGKNKEEDLTGTYKLVEVLKSGSRNIKCEMQFEMTK